MLQRIYYAVVFVFTGKFPKSKEVQLPYFVAEWACDSLKAIQKGDKKKIIDSVYFPLYEITKQFPYLLQGKDSVRYLHYLKDPEIPE